MSGKTLLLVAPVALGLLAACSDRGSDEGVGGVTASEADALNDAADMLDNRPAPAWSSDEPAENSN